jgi:hypothetical protein
LIAYVFVLGYRRKEHFARRTNKRSLGCHQRSSTMQVLDSPSSSSSEGEDSPNSPSGTPLANWKEHRDRIKNRLGTYRAVENTPGSHDLDSSSIILEDSQVGILAANTPLPEVSPVLSNQKSSQKKKKIRGAGGGAATATAMAILRAMEDSDADSDQEIEDNSMEKISADVLRLQQKQEREHQSTLKDLEKTRQKERFEMQTLLITTKQKMRQEMEVEAEKYSQEVEEMKAVMKTLKEEVKKYQKQVRRQQEDKDKLKIELASKTTRLSQRQVDYNGLLERYRKKEGDTLDQNSMSLKLSNKIEKYQGELLIAKKEIAIVNNRYQKKEEEAVALNSRVAELENSLRRAVDEKEEAFAKLKNQEEAFGIEKEASRVRGLKLEAERHRLEKKIIDLTSTVDNLNDKERVSSIEMTAARKRMAMLQESFDKMHYDAERERKLAKQLEKAKRTIEMHRRQTRSTSLQLHSTMEGVLTMEQYRAVVKQKKTEVRSRRNNKGEKGLAKKDRLSFLTDFSRIGMQSNMGKKLVINAGYKEIEKPLMGVFANKRRHHEYPMTSSDVSIKKENVPTVGNYDAAYSDLSAASDDNAGGGVGRIETAQTGVSEAQQAPMSPNSRKQMEV